MFTWQRIFGWEGDNNKGRADKWQETHGITEKMIMDCVKLQHE